MCTENDVLSMVGGLGGDFYQDIYGSKLFGMHSGSVLCGLDAGNANTDLKMSILPLCQVGNVYVHRINRVVFSVFGGLGGDFAYVALQKSPPRSPNIEESPFLPPLHAHVPNPNNRHFSVSIHVSCIKTTQNTSNMHPKQLCLIYVLTKVPSKASKQRKNDPF